MAHKKTRKMVTTSALIIMRFSLITITYNSERYLKQTLQSVAEQEFKDFEHILWDGGSRDGTLEIARQFPHVTIYQGADSGIF